MIRISSGSKKELIHLLLRIRSSKLTSKCTDSISSDLFVRGFTSTTVNSSSAMEPPKITNFADVEEVRETAVPEGKFRIIRVDVGKYLILSAK
jgi:hypothetical protein